MIHSRFYRTQSIIIDAIGFSGQLQIYPTSTTIENVQIAVMSIFIKSYMMLINCIQQYVVPYIQHHSPMDLILIVLYR